MSLHSNIPVIQCHMHRIMHENISLQGKTITYHHIYSQVQAHSTYTCCKRHRRKVLENWGKKIDILVKPIKRTTVNVVHVTDHYRQIKKLPERCLQSDNRNGQVFIQVHLHVWQAWNKGHNGSSLSYPTWGVNVATRIYTVY